MLFKVTTVILLLVVYIQCIEGINRVIVVSEQSDIDDDNFDKHVPGISATGSGSGSRVFKASLTLQLCCTFGNCSCPSLYNALANLTSNVLIKITTDVTLSSIILLADLTNITITGHNNPTVNCNNSGGLHLISCHNCTIEGISWNSCGDKSSRGNFSRPVLQVINSSNITFKNCLFQHSIGQAIVLSQMNGNVSISHCNFLSNNHYEGHGSAIRYSSNGTSKSSITFMIVSSNFTHNEGAKSVVHFDQSSKSAKSCEYLYLQNSNFYRNKAVPIYLSNQNLYISGNIQFNGNVAENGGGIYISHHSNVIVHNSATVKFIHNRANGKGGAIFLSNHSSIVFKEHHMLQRCYDDKPYYTIGDQYLTRSIFIEFCNNTANKFGGNIYVHKSRVIFGDIADVKFDDDLICHVRLPRNISARSIVHMNNQSNMIFEGNSRVTFSGNNKAVTLIYSTISFEGISTVNFTGNSAIGNGRVMYIDDQSTIKFEGSSTINFINNTQTADGKGCVMYIGNHSTIIFEGNSTVSFTNNTAYGNGGVMYIDYYSTITFEGNSTVSFTNNTAYGNGGVMYIDYYSTIIFEGNSTVSFTNNTAYGNGGVMYIDYYPTIIFEGNSTVSFTNNTAYGNGGVMYIDYYPTIIFEGNSTVSFTDNIANGNGGVMYIEYFSYNSRSVITFEGNSTVSFTDNTANDYGGVMCIDHYSTIIFDGNSTVSFTDNTVYGNGGVMYIGYYSTIIFKGNSTVSFTDNTVYGNGGVMYIDYYSTIIFEGNSTVSFTNNTAYGNGGVMYAFYYPTITFEGNSTIKFYHNHGKSNVGVMYIYYDL